MTEMSNEFVPDAADPDQRINGVLDVPRSGRVSGWAIDRADENAAVIVTILREGRVIGEVRADSHRPDLQRGGIGTGRYGFALDLEPPLDPGFEFTITAIARADDGASGEVRPVGRAKPSQDPDRRLAERTFSELTELRATLAQLVVNRDRGSEMRALEVLDRVEVVQARLERAVSTAEPSEGRPHGRALVIAVTLALLTGAGSLALGVFSMLAG